MRKYLDGSKLKGRDFVESRDVIGWVMPPVEGIEIGQYFEHDLHPLFGIPSDK